jgi:hypothetical protein
MRSVSACARLWASVEEPTPPLAPRKAIERPTNGAEGSAYRSVIERITPSAFSGGTRYSLTPLRISSR